MAYIYFSGIRRLQHILLKVSLLLGVEVFAPVKFEHVLPPETDVTGQGKADSIFLWFYITSNNIYKKNSKPSY